MDYFPCEKVKLQNSFVLFSCIHTEAHCCLTLNLSVFKILKSFLFLRKEVTLRNRNVKQEMKLSFAPDETKEVLVDGWHGISN